MALAKGALEGVVVRLVGEVSETSSKRGYKAVYFTVKDADAALPCMMWMGRYKASGVDLAVGQLVEPVSYTHLAPAAGSPGTPSRRTPGRARVRRTPRPAARTRATRARMSWKRRRPEEPRTLSLIHI